MRWRSQVTRFRLSILVAQKRILNCATVRHSPYPVCLDHRITNAFSKMPGIASIPILGWLFRSRNEQASTTDLVVIVTASIVDPLTLPGPEPDLPKTVTPYMDKSKFDISMPKKGELMPISIISVSADSRLRKRWKYLAQSLQLESVTPIDSYISPAGYHSAEC